MNGTTTVDVKGLDHSEKEATIFPAVDSLNGGDTLRIVLDFNPIPLVFMLKAQDGIEVNYETEGPDEWILQVKKATSADDQRRQFRELFEELRGGEASEELSEKAKQLLGSVDATTLGAMEQELIREGVSHDEIRKSLCDIHLEALRESLVDKRVDVDAPHPVHTFMAEHEVILEALHELGDIVGRLKTADSLDAIEGDLAKLEDIAHHLVEAESHHQREEDILFPALEKHDVVEPPAIMKLDHVEFKKRKQELYQLARNPRGEDFAHFKSRVVDLGEYLTKELDSHIFKENNILYQIALQVLDTEEWDRIKKLCDELGYCCFTPSDQEEAHKHG